MAHQSEFTKALTKGILEQAKHFKWSVQGLGMMRLYLSTEMRLHIWHSSLMVPDVTLVHDHPWHFQSMVIVGKLVNKRYFPEFDGPADAARTSGWQPRRRVPDGTHIGGPELFVKQQLFCGPGGCVKSAPEDIILFKALQADEHCHPGDLYSQSKYQIHYTEAEDCTVTLVSRSFDGDRDHANIYRKGGLPFVSAEPRPAIPQEIDLVVGETLRKHFGEAVGV